MKLQVASIPENARIFSRGVIAQENFTALTYRTERTYTSVMELYCNSSTTRSFQDAIYRIRTPHNLLLDENRISNCQLLYASSCPIFLFFTLTQLFSVRQLNDWEKLALAIVTKNILAELNIADNEIELDEPNEINIWLSKFEYWRLRYEEQHLYHGDESILLYNHLKGCLLDFGPSIISLPIALGTFIGYYCIIRMPLWFDILPYQQ